MDIYQELELETEEDPGRFEDGEYLEDINSRLKQRASYLIVRRDKEFVFVDENVDAALLLQLPLYGNEEINASSGTYIDSNEQALVKQIDFVYRDKAEGSLFIVTRLEETVPEIKNLMVDVVVSIILILILTACMLSLWIYTSLMNPIKKLQVAAQNIKEGNLDFTIEPESKDEIGELCRSFEEMRQRLKDNTEEKLAAERENKALISNIAHDLKTPITALKGYAEGIMDGVADTPEKQEKYIRTIYNKATEMDTLINELTLYSKIDTNRIPYNFARINVADYFGDCIEEIGLDLEAKNIGLAYFNYTEETVQIIADPEQLKRVIHNIVNNSVKYFDTDVVVVRAELEAWCFEMRRFLAGAYTKERSLLFEGAGFSVDFFVSEDVEKKTRQQRREEDCIMAVRLLMRSKDKSSYMGGVYTYIKG